MPRLSDGMILYHGGFCKVSAPELAKCAPFKDFGQGFYLTSSREQAESFIPLSVRKAVSQGLIPGNAAYGVVNTYRVIHAGALKCFFFENADADWLHCIAAHRRQGIFPESLQKMQDYDVVAGKIADDATNFTILAYLNLAYGPVGSEKADALCIGQLLPERLKDQFCFRTEAAIRCLFFMESEKVWIH